MSAILAVTFVVAVVWLFAQQPRGGAEPVVLELFTSQGCSSCPPADELLRKLANEKNLNVIPLAYHVDYWNYLGWKDPFSSAEWSQRQRDYVHAMKLEGAYTPQLVINGSRQMVGSSTFQIRAAIEEESKRKPRDHVSLDVGDSDVIVRADAKSPAELIVVVYENDVTTQITRGENKGRTQTNDAIVRKLVRVGAVRGAVEKRVPMTLTKSMGVVALLQDPVTRRITTAASRP